MQSRARRWSGVKFSTSQVQNSSLSIQIGSHLFKVEAVYVAKRTIEQFPALRLPPFSGITVLNDHPWEKTLSMYGYLAILNGGRVSKIETGNRLLSISEFNGTHRLQTP
jgi:hypothetical protein